MKKILIILLSFVGVCFANGWVLDFGLGVDNFPLTFTSTLGDKIDIASGGFLLEFGTSYFSDSFGFSFDSALSSSDYDKSETIDKYYQDYDNIYSTSTGVARLILFPKVSLTLLSIEPNFRWSMFTGYSYMYTGFHARGVINGEEDRYIVDYRKHQHFGELLTELSAFIDDTGVGARIESGLRYDFDTKAYSMPFEASLFLHEFALNVRMTFFDDYDDIAVSFGIHLILDKLTKDK